LTGQAERVIFSVLAAEIVGQALLASLFRRNFETGGFETYGSASPEGLTELGARRVGRVLDFAGRRFGRLSLQRF
jgi:hypothetical protein